MNKLFSKINFPTLIIVSILFLIFLIPAILKLKNGYIIQERIQYKLIDSLLKPLDFVYFPLAFFPNKLPKYELFYSQKDFRAIEADLPKNIGTEELTRHLTNRQNINGTFVANGKKYQVQISIKGEVLANYANYKKSLKIKFEEPFNGRTTWDFVVPEQRKFNSVGASEYLAKRLGILTQQWDYAWLRINNEQMGVYEMVDETDTSFLEHNDLLPDDLIFREEKRPEVVSANYAMSIFDSNGSWKVDNKPSNPDSEEYSSIENFKKVLILPEQEFNLKITEILDMDQFLRWSAILYLLNDQHQDNRNNARLIYLKEKGQFWILPDHIFVQPVTQFIDQFHRHTLNEKVLGNPQNFWARNKIIWSLVSAPNFEKDLMTYLNSKMSIISAPIFQDSTKAFRFLTFKNTINSQNKIIHSNIQIIKSYFDLYDIKTVTTNLSNDNSGSISSTKIMASSFFQPNIDKITLQFQKIPKAADLIVFFDLNGNSKLDKSDQLLSQFTTDNTSRFQLIDINLPLIATGFDTSIYDSIRPLASSNLLIETKDNQTFKLVDLKISFSNSLTGEKLDSDDQFTNLFNFESKLPDFIVQTDPSKYLIKAGEYTINQDIIIPSGELKIEPGTTFKMAPGVSILSRASIKSIGTNEKPIIFTKLDENQNWGSLLILSAKDKSEFRFNTVEYGSGYHKNGLSATGALSAYFSDVVFDNGHITYSGDDDGIGVKHANAIITNSLFDKNFADHIDFDMVTGEVSSNKFDNDGFGNDNSDGLDVSFSKLTVKNNTFHKSPDKCISAGEESDLNILENVMDGCKYGVAVKDDSMASITKNTIKNNKIGIGTYLKKPLYEKGGTAIIANNIFENNGQDTNQQENSSIIKE